MIADDTLEFRSFYREAPEYRETWRPAGEGARWDRHYLVAPDHRLRLTEGRRVELYRLGTLSGFRTVDLLLDAAFPLDWAALKAIGRVLPAELRGLSLDGRSAQSFVDSLAHPDLPQASLHTRVSRYAYGTTIAETAWLSVPEWRAEAVSVRFESTSAGLLRALLAAAELSADGHRDLEDWLRHAHRAAARPAGAARLSTTRSALAVA